MLELILFKKQTYCKKNFSPPWWRANFVNSVFQKQKEIRGMGNRGWWVCVGRCLYRYISRSGGRNPGIQSQHQTDGDSFLQLPCSQSMHTNNRMTKKTPALKQSQEARVSPSSSLSVQEDNGSQENLFIRGQEEPTAWCHK